MLVIDMPGGLHMEQGLLISNYGQQGANEPPNRRPCGNHQKVSEVDRAGLLQIGPVAVSRRGIKRQ